MEKKSDVSSISEFFFSFVDGHRRKLNFLVLRAKVFYFFRKYLAKQGIEVTYKVSHV